MSLNNDMFAQSFITCLVLSFNTNVLFARQVLRQRELNPSVFTVSNISIPSA